MKTRSAVCAALAVAASLWAAQALPIITDVVQFGGNTPEETPAQYTGQTFTHPNLGEITVGTFGENAPAFRDRTHQWNGATAGLPLPSYLVGGEYLMLRNDDRGFGINLYQLDVTVSEPALVYVLVDNRMPDGDNTTPPHGGAPLSDWPFGEMDWLQLDGFVPAGNGLNRSGNPTWPDEVGVDESAGGTGPGESIEQFASVYVRQVPAGTFSLYEPNNPSRNMYGVVITAMPGSVNNPPVIENISPGSNTVFNDAADGIRFDATTAAPNRLEPANINLVLNGVDVSENLIIGGSATDRTVAYEGLVSNQAYQAVITVTDNVGREQSITIIFDTFSFEGALFIEAEDYNYGSGQFLTDPTPGAYAGQEGVRGIDYQDANETTLAAQYRTTDYVGLAVTGDGLRPGFGTPGPNDHQVTAFVAGDWMNYTRNLPAGTYQVALRASVGTVFPHALQLDLVQGSATSEAQSLFPLGRFVVRRTASDPTWNLFPLIDATGSPVELTLSGDTTLRLTSLQSLNPTVNLNYLMLLPAAQPAAASYVSLASPAPGALDVPQDALLQVHLAHGSETVDPGSVTLRFNGQDVTLAADVASTAGGITVAYDPPGLLPLGTTAGVEVTFTDGSETTSVDWSFTTVAHPAIITQVTEIGGDNSDVEPAAYSGQTFLHRNLGNIVLDRFRENATAYRDRVHQWNGAATTLPLPSYLVGREYIIIRNDNRDNPDLLLDVTVSEPALVYLLIDNRLGDGNNPTPPQAGAPLDQWTLMPWVFADGYEPAQTGINRADNNTLPDEIGADEGAGGSGPGLSLEQWASIYVKQVPAGTFTLAQADNAGRNMYGVVVAALSTHSAAPAVSIISPANNSSFPAAPASVTFTAQTAVEGSTIDKVEYLLGNQVLGEATTAPYSVTWANAGPGRHAVRARATAATGETALSAPVSVIVGELISVNFELLADPPFDPPAGYLPDYGDVYGNRGNGYSYGWDVDNTSQSRRRDSIISLDARYDTLTHMQGSLDGIPAGRVWEIELPNGWYRVQAVAGDATATDGVYHLTAEGVTVLQGSPSPSQRWIQGAALVHVTDGRLSLTSGPAANNNKLAYVDIAAAPAPNLWEIVAGTPDLTTLRTAIETAGLEAVLQGTDPLTVFAPNNAAFAALPPGALDGLLADPVQLGAVLTYHALAGTQLAADLVAGDYDTLLAGASVAVTTPDGVVMVNEATVIAADWIATNGAIHVIDSVLLPSVTPDQPVVAPPVIADGQISITWTGQGEVQTAETITGPWTGTGNSSGSFSEAIDTSGSKYYRIGPIQ